MTPGARISRAASATLVALTLAAGPAAAHEPLRLPLDYDPTIAWFGTIAPTFGGGGRIRVVHAGGTGAIALTVNQVSVYQQAYRRALAHLAQRMSVDRAEPHARHAAVRAVLAAAPGRRATGADVLIEIEEVFGRPGPIALRLVR